jgi:adenylate cyclase class 2
MHEIEAKIRVQDFEDVTAKLKTSGAQFLRQVRESDTYLDIKGQLERKGCGLRIRRQQTESAQKAMVTFKGAKVKSRYKSRPEYEMEISSAETAERLFSGLGYTPRIIVEKNRAMWAVGECVVCLDEVAELGSFVEVEGPAEDSIEAVLTTLGLAEQPHIHMGYAKMLSELRNNQPSPQGNEWT